MTRGELKEQSRMWNATEIPLSISMYNPDIEKYCQQAYLAGAEPREKRIKKLEQKLEQTEKALADYQFNYPTIKELTEGTCFAHLKSLEQENAELKEKLNFRTQYYQGQKAKEQLTKAKEIIREIMKYDIPTLDYEKAEQFLKENEK